jgi:hypothetical protein
MKLLFVFLVVALGYGCSAGEVGVKDASGDTPVRYVICSVGEKNCFVAARFKDLDACQSHKDWADMLCDSRSKPGVMICTRDSGESIATAYCTL